MHVPRHRFGSVLVVALLVALVFSAVLFVAPAARASHDVAPWASFGAYSQHLSFSRTNPITVSDGSGTFYVFYITNNRLTGVANLNVTKFASGGMFNGPTRLSDKQVNDVNNVVSTGSWLSAAVDHSGNVYVAWVRVPGGGLQEQVYVSKSADKGATWQPAVHASNFVVGPGNLYPSLAVAPDGTVYLAWIQVWGGFVNISVSKSTNGGSSFTGPTNASGQGRGGSAIYESLTVDSGGRVYLAYTGANFGTGDIHINVTWSNDGVSWAPPTRVTPTTTFAIYPNIVAAGEKVHLDWLDYRGIYYGYFGVWYTRSDDRGATWAAQMPISQGYANPAGWSPSLTAYGTTLMVVWAGSHTGLNGLSYAISTNGGSTWYPEEFFYPGFAMAKPSGALDMNGTVFAGVQDTATSPDNGIGLLFWNSPPLSPSITSVTPGTTSLTVTWTANPEKDVVAYRVYRSLDGSSYQYAATVNAPSTTFTDTGLANGTYWYRVEAVDSVGLLSHPSTAWYGTVGPTLQQLIAALQAQLNSANANLAALQTQLNVLQNQLNSMKATDQANYTALKNQLNAIQSQLDTLRTQQATQTISYANLAFEIIVVVLLVVLLLNQMRKPKSPQMMMAQSGETPKKPDEEL